MKAFFTSKWFGIGAGGLVAIIMLLGFYWSMQPGMFSTQALARQQATENQQQIVTGYMTTTALIEVGETLLNKPGGYISNDVFPPGVLLDNITSWEFGALEMLRDLALAMRKDFSRSQSQSLENTMLVEAQPKFNIDHRSWLFPSAESEYRKGLAALVAYRDDLADPSQGKAQFYARADNLRDWLKQVEKRLGSISQRLSASVAQERIDTSLAGDAAAQQSTPNSPVLIEKTSWWRLDNNFYEARGASWALLHFLQGVEQDFAQVLEKKNALVSLQQIIRELEATQQTVWSPMILNGSGFGMLANHSLVMANYISRANAALIELTELLNQG